MTADDVRRLYGLPPDRFTAERNALASRLRAGGEQEAAAEVAALRKPSLSAWAVNQLVRERTPQLADLWKAAERLRKAHGGKGDFRQAVEAEREALETLLASAAELLRRRGHRGGDPLLQRVRATLQAAAADPGARRRVEAGTLDEDLAPPGFEVLG